MRSNLETSGGLLGDLDGAPEIAEAPHQAVDDLGAVASIKVVGAEVPVLDTVAEHEVRSREHRGRDGEDGLLGAASGLDAEEQRVQIAVLDSDAGPGGGDQGGLEPGAALADSRRPALARALVVARTQPGPRDEVTTGGEARHVDADLRQDDLCDEVTH